MKNSLHICLLLCFILLSMGSFLTTKAQNLQSSRQSSYYAYFYKITDAEAQTIYQSTIWKYSPMVFHTLIDSIPTDSIYKKTLPKGHYLKTFAQNNKETIEITSVNSFHVFIFNNTTDLNVQVYNENGKQISDARLLMDDKEIKFNKLTQTYTLPKTNRQGMLKVEYAGQTGFYDVTRRYNNAWIKRLYVKTLFQTPLQYAWRPVKFTFSLPYDGVKSIIKQGTYGSIYQTKHFFIKLYNKAACLVDPFNCYEYNRFAYKFKSYVITDKPIYRPNDTLRVKAYISKKNGTPLKKSVFLSLYNGKKNIELAKISPKKPGSYVYQMILHDSLQLQLDKSFFLDFSDKRGNEYTDFGFEYKDYELKNNTLEINLSKIYFFKNDSIILNIKAKDANDMTLKDAKVEVLIKPNKVIQYREKQVFLPDTLYHKNHTILSKNETQIAIATHDFPYADFNAKVFVNLTTTDNEFLQKSTDFYYIVEQKNFQIDMLPDSLSITYKENDLRKNTHAKVWAKINNKEEELVYEGEIPTTIPWNPLYESLRVENEHKVNSFDLFSIPDAFNCYTIRTSNQVEIKVENPNNIGFHYDIFKKNKRIEKGYTHQLHFVKKEQSKTDYYIFINYIWAGNVKQLSYRVPLDEHKMNIEITQNKVVFPGQTTDVEIKLTDYKGKPVANADVSAFALTSKFNFKLPILPTFTKKIDKKNNINSFSIKNNKHKDLGKYRLNYQYWKQKAQIDSIAYYQFTYPQNDLYRFESETQDSITQFAPFVFSSGQKLPIHVVYVDNIPVYFNWNTNYNPYSMKINPGYHQIKLRTTDAEYELDSVYFNKGKKLIFSLNDSIKNSEVKKYKRNIQLTDLEKRRLYPYMFSYNNKFLSNEFVTISNNGNLMLLHPDTRNNYRNIRITGPVVGNVSLQYLMSDIEKNFHHEPNFEYEFTKDWMKMREKKNYPQFFLSNDTNQSIGENVLTQKIVDEWMIKSKEKNRKEEYVYNNPKTTIAGNGRLEIIVVDGTTKDIRLPLNSILTKPNDPLFFRIYNGNNVLFHDLKPDVYELILLYEDGFYTRSNLLQIKPDGLNYYKIELPKSLLNDDLGIKFNKLLMANATKTNFDSDKTKTNHVMQYQSQYYDLTYDISKGVLVQGYVTDKSGPIPGVSIIIKGTRTGTETNFDGYYSIILPIGYELVYSYVGMDSVTRLVNGSGVLNVSMGSSEYLLEEVVIVGYGANRRSEAAFTSSVTSTLSGKVSGVTVTAATGIPGSSQKVVIRGMNSINDDFGSKALIIINGMPYNGHLDELMIDQFTSVSVIKDASAVALYGSRAQNGVIIINTNQTLPNNPELKEAEIQIIPDLMQSSLRNRFNDMAYWQPTLQTDAKGEAKFTVTYPDDITTWDTHVIAIEDKKVGSVSTKIKSYKPLMAQLFTPRFLVEGDTAVLIGKTNNYIPEKLNLINQFEINNQKIWTKNREVGEFILDSLLVVAPKDSLKVKYFLQKPDGYLDGELRDIPIFPMGMEKTIGQFYVLQNDTLIVTKFQPNRGKVKLSLQSDLLNVILNEIDHVKYYKYDCNEQMASKLKALLAEENIKMQLGQKFKDKKDVEKIIRKLKKNENKYGLWGWWNVSETVPWISLHVAEAIGKAIKMGYKIDVDKINLVNTLIWMFQNTANFDTKIRIIKIGIALDLVMNYELFYNDLNKFSLTNFSDELQFMEVGQLLGEKVAIDKILKNKQETMLGNLYFKADTKQNNVYTNDLMNTLKVYKILQANRHDHLLYSDELSKIRNYFLENRKSGFWTNTFESVQILETIIPDLMMNKSYGKPEVEITGDVMHKVNEFPFEIEVNPKDEIRITKKGTSTIYMDVSQKYWETHPEVIQNDFEILTHFSNNSTHLTAGKEVALIVTLKVKKDVDYIMINVPIPAGCSYADAQNKNRLEVHRELFKNETSIFVDHLSKGVYTFEVKLNPRYSGNYTINPAKVELMYFPTFNANNESKRVMIGADKN